ncbi:helix-turn-helix transcriptional regulator [Thermocoleostomius sinensis]|uniref:AraC family transcriptional regulator n=1 Tax=Thermocoleostomius sinensis A174 TaxID=2016057 RepID=A0A9E9CBK4_9CYAN|nr:AraC family transcriptional regulator [Thermocoleostomius sinensis]WAL62522.1 AraC family transcriptional regulator [Thermocoleostomius sinensis A174]
MQGINVLAEQEFSELRKHNLSQGTVLEHWNGFDRIENRENPVSKEHCWTISFRPELCLEMIDEYYYVDVNQHSDHSDYRVLVSKFYLDGCHRVLTPDVPGIPEEYLEQAGYNYLFFLPDIQETEQFFAHQRLHLIRLEVDPSLFITFDADNSPLPLPLQRLLEGKEDDRFHQAIGRITPAMQTALQHILACPYQGAMKRLYLESKVLELLALQIYQWAEDQTRSTKGMARPLRPDDIERLHHAREVLMQNLAHPPSLIDLARQVGLNDYKLKQGFRQVFGTTVFGYLQMHRMNQAKQLLADSTLSVAGVAQKVGYTSQSRFCDAFKRQFNISPKAYRMSLKRA